MHTLHLILTGGTIDSIYTPGTDSPPLNDASVIAPYIEDVLKPPFKVEATTVCMKDSRDLDGTDAQNILQAVEASPHQHILVTHGTFTMAQRMRFLAENLGHESLTTKRVVLTGAMQPLTGCPSTLADAGANLGYAIGTLQHVNPGVYLSMNMQTFPAHAPVFKNVAEGIFEARKPPAEETDLLL